MQRPRSPRSIGRLMLATLLVAVLVGDGLEVVRLQRRSLAYRRSASSHWQESFWLREKARSAAGEAWRLRVRAGRDPGALAEAEEDGRAYLTRAARFGRLADREGGLAETYRTAARYPFLPIWPATSGAD